MKVYIVVWSDPFDDWCIEGVFSTKEKAEDYIDTAKKSRSDYWIDERDVDGD